MSGILFQTCSGGHYCVTNYHKSFWYKIATILFLFHDFLSRYIVLDICRTPIHGISRMVASGSWVSYMDAGYLQRGLPKKTYGSYMGTGDMGKDNTNLIILVKIITNPISLHGIS
jgi:hypothetical protein